MSKGSSGGESPGKVNQGTPKRNTLKTNFVTPDRSLATLKTTPGTGAVPTSITKDDIKILMGSGGFYTDDEGLITFGTRTQLDGHGEIVNLANSVVGELRERLDIVGDATLLPATILAELGNHLGEESASNSNSKTIKLINAFKEKSKHFAECKDIIEGIGGDARYAISNNRLKKILKREILWTCSDFMWDLDEILFQIKPQKEASAAATPKAGDKEKKSLLAKKEEKSLLVRMWGELKSLEDKEDKEGLPELMAKIYAALTASAFSGSAKEMPLKSTDDVVTLTQRTPSPLKDRDFSEEQLEVIQNQLRIIADFKAEKFPKPDLSSSIGDDAVSRSLKAALKSPTSTSSGSNSRGSSSSSRGANEGRESYDMNSEFFAYRVLWDEAKLRPAIQFKVQSGKKRPKGASEDGHQGDHVTAYAVYLENFFSCVSPIVEYQDLSGVVGMMLSLAVQDGATSQTSFDQEVVTNDTRREFAEERKKIAPDAEIVALNFLIKSYQIDRACRSTCLIATKYLKAINQELGSSIPNIINVGESIEAATTVNLSTGSANEDAFISKLRDVTTYVLTHSKINSLEKEIEDLRQNTSLDVQNRVANLTAQLGFCQTRQAELLSKAGGAPSENPLSLQSLQNILSGASSSAEAATSQSQPNDARIANFIKEVALKSMKACFDFDPAFYLLLLGNDYDATSSVALPFQGVIERHFRIMGVAVAPLLSFCAESENICEKIVDEFITHLSAKTDFSRAYKGETTQKGAPLVKIDPSSSGSSSKESPAEKNIGALQSLLAESREKISHTMEDFFQNLRMERAGGEPSPQQQFTTILKQRAEAYQAVTKQTEKGRNPSGWKDSCSLFGDDNADAQLLPPPLTTSAPPQFLSTSPNTSPVKSKVSETIIKSPICTIS